MNFTELVALTVQEAANAADLAECLAVSARVCGPKYAPMASGVAEAAWASLERARKAKEGIKLDSPLARRIAGVKEAAPGRD